MREGKEGKVVLLSEEVFAPHAHVWLAHIMTTTSLSHPLTIFKHALMLLI